MSAPIDLDALDQAVAAMSALGEAGCRCAECKQANALLSLTSAKDRASAHAAYRPSILPIDRGHLLSLSDWVNSWPIDTTVIPTARASLVLLIDSAHMLLDRADKLAGCARAALRIAAHEATCRVPWEPCNCEVGEIEALLDVGMRRVTP